MHRFRGFCACALLCALTLLCAGPAGAQRGEDGTLRLLVWQAPTTLNPHMSSLENGGVAPDGRSVTWKLKQDVRWADGEPFTADDVVFTSGWVSNPEVAAGTSATYGPIERIEALGDHTVRITFKDANPAWTLPFVSLSGMILPRHVFEPYAGTRAEDAPANRLVIGTDPYRVASFENEDLLIIGEDIVNTIKIVYEINPCYREPDQPHFERVELRGGGDPKVAARAVFDEGSIDYAWNVQVAIEELEALEALGKARLIAPPAVYVERILFNFADPNRETADGERSSLEFPHPILTDLRVRQALTLAVDRAAVAALYGRTGPIATNLLIEPKTYACPNTSRAYDLDKAAALLDEAGWVEVEPKVIDGGVFFGPVTGSTNTWRHFYADLEMYAGNNANPEPDDYMLRWLCAEAAQQANEWSAPNRARYCNQAYDALCNQFGASLDSQERRALLIAMNDLLIEDAAAIPLVGRAPAFGLSNQIALGREPTAWDAETWDIANWRRR